MTFRRLLAPLLGAAFLVIAAFLGAGVATAHPGHAHRDTVAAPAMVEVAPSAAEAIIAIALAEMAAEAGDRGAPAIGPAMPPHFEVAMEAAQRFPDAPCRGMCCDNTPCGGCMNIAFGKTSLPAPLLGVLLLAAVEPRKLAGRLAEGPNEPPRAFT